jgi:hypothetical protein
MAFFPLIFLLPFCLFAQNHLFEKGFLLTKNGRLEGYIRHNDIEMTKIVEFKTDFNQSESQLGCPML